MSIEECPRCNGYGRNEDDMLCDLCGARGTIKREKDGTIRHMRKGGPPLEDLKRKMKCQFCHHEFRFGDGVAGIHPKTKEKVVLCGRCIRRYKRLYDHFGKFRIRLFWHDWVESRARKQP